MEMNYILFEDEARENLFPFTLTRPVSEIRTGILTLTEKWRMMLKKPVSFLTADYLSSKYALTTGENNLLINGGVIPDEDLIVSLNSLKPGEQLLKDGKLIGVHLLKNQIKSDSSTLKAAGGNVIDYPKNILKIEQLWDIFLLNEKAIIQDFKLLTYGLKTEPVSATNKVLGLENVFISKGAKVECSIINATLGPVYIGSNAEVMEGCMIRGPFALGNDSTLKMGAKIYGATTIGPHCKIGGEVSNSVIFGFSNKAHDGFLGNSVLGEWCNLGADTNTSNLKNNYGNVKVWNYTKNNFMNSGLQFCGLFMGDHSKSAINTMFNTGTVVGVSTNIFGSGFPEKYVPSFKWGGAASLTDFHLNKALELASEVYKRRNLMLDTIEKNILTYIKNNQSL